MSREIKFRAWNPNAKQYQGYAGGDIHMPLHEAGALASSPLIYEFEQYTGLKDKNGVEIYEGDVIENLNGVWLEVYWNVEEGMFKQRTCNKTNVEDQGYEWLENERTDLPLIYNLKTVIGNIYENPELLEETK